MAALRALKSGIRRNPPPQSVLVTSAPGRLPDTSMMGLLPGADIAAILLIYGFPITLLGFALSYAQLKPVPCRTTAEALRLRDAQATDIQKQACPPLLRLPYVRTGGPRPQRLRAAADCAHAPPAVRCRPACSGRSCPHVS